MTVLLTNSKDIYANSVSVMSQKLCMNIMDIINDINKFIFLTVGKSARHICELWTISPIVSTTIRIYSRLC